MAGMATAQKPQKRKGKRTSSEANLENRKDEMSRNSKALSFVSESSNTPDESAENMLDQSCEKWSSLEHKQNDTVHLTTDATPEHQDKLAGIVDSGTFYTRRQLSFNSQAPHSDMKDKKCLPHLPGTQIQIGSSQRLFASDTTRLEMDLPCNPSQNTMSPESGITFTPPHYAQSPPWNINGSSGIGSVQGVEMDYFEYDVLNGRPFQPIKEMSLVPAEKTNKYSSSNKHMQKFLQRRFVVLKRELMPKGIADRLFADLVIEEKSLEAIKDAQGRRQKCDVLIKAISHSLDSSKDDLAHKIKDAFKKEKFGYVFDIYDEYSYPARNTNTDESNKQWESKLETFAAKMEDELDPRHFIDELVSKEVLEFDEHENIMNVQFKPEKIACLIKYLKRKTRKIFEDFCHVIMKSYGNSKEIDELCSKQQCKEREKEELAIPLTVSIAQRNEELSCQMTPTATTHIKFTFDGEARDIERMIVDENSPHPNDNLREEAMDVAAYEVMDTQFSSIRIVMSAMSQRSEMQFIKKCKQSPVFLGKILQSLINQDHLKKLKERNISRILFEIKIQWPKNKISLHDITANLRFVEKEMTKVDILQIMRKTEGSEAALEHIIASESREECFDIFVKFLLYERNDTAIDILVEELKKGKMKEVVERAENARNKRDKNNCCCHIKKETIVAHFTLMEMEMTKIADIIKTFSDFPGFDSDIQDQFKTFLTKKSTGSKSDAFLRKLLELPDDGIQLCLLEEQLHSTGQNQLLEKITESKMDEKDIKMTDDDIRRNWSFLCDELEPNQYFDMLKDIDEADSLCERILAETSREKRCVVLLNYILSQCSDDANQILFQFKRELRKHNPDILQYIVDSREIAIGEQQSLKEGIIGSYKHIVEEIEPRSIMKIFEERQELTKEDIDYVASASTRRARAVKLVHCVLKGPETKCQCLIDALRYAGYVSLLKKIQDSIKTYKECPRLYHVLQNEECYIFKGELEIDGAGIPEDIQPSTSKNIFPKWNLVTNWVLENYFSDKRDNPCNDTSPDDFEGKMKTDGEQLENDYKGSSEQPTDTADATGKTVSTCKGKKTVIQQKSVNPSLQTNQQGLSVVEYIELDERDQFRSHPRSCMNICCQSKCREDSQSPKSRLNDFRNDEIFEMNASPSSVATLRPFFCISDEDESEKRMEDILKMIDADLV